MIELDSTVVILMAEALAALLVIILFFFFRSKNKNSGDQLAAHKLIDKLEDTENFKSKKLSEMITEHCDIEQGELKELLKEISQSERVLYQKVIQIFLNKDEKLLKGIDKQIDNLSEPYCQLLTNFSGSSASTEKLDVLENKVSEQLSENQRLSEQLSTAMNTMDEITTEYTKVFAGTQTELELENSSKKMFSVFRDAEQRIRNLAKEVETP